MEETPTAHAPLEPPVPQAALSAAAGPHGDIAAATPTLVTAPAATAHATLPALDPSQHTNLSPTPCQ